MELLQCIICLKEKEVIKFEKRKNGSLRNVCEPCRNIRKRVALWMAFFKHFDYKCQCCGEDDLRFLTIDHVKNDGYLDHRNNIQVLRNAKIEGYPRDKYTCLCFNCNCGKARNKGTCPHQCIEKGDYFDQLVRACEHIVPRSSGRPKLYIGDLNERTKAAQIMFKIKQMSQEEVKQVLELLQTTVGGGVA